MLKNPLASSYNDDAPRKAGAIENFVRKAIDPNYAVTRQCEKIREVVAQTLIDAANVIGLSYVEISKHGDLKPNAVDDFLVNGTHEEVDLKNGTISIRAFVRQPGLLMLTVCQSDKTTPQEEQRPFQRSNGLDMRHLLDVPPTPSHASMYCSADIVTHDATRPLSLAILDILRIFSLENNLTLLTELDVTSTVTYVFIDKA